jgi:hypothetical protein
MTAPNARVIGKRIDVQPGEQWEVSVRRVK